MSVLAALDKMDVKLQQDVFDWKVNSWYSLLREVFLLVEFDPCDKTVLEVGANKGGLSLFFSMLGCKRVLCSDHKPEYLSRARKLHLKWERRCSYIAADAAMLPIRSNSFDLVIMKSVLGGIYASGGRNAAVESINQICRVLKKDGICILLEQLEGNPLTRWQRTREFPNRRWHYFKKEEFSKDAILMKKFQKVEYECLHLFGPVSEHFFSPTSTLVHIACMMDRVVGELVLDNWKHVIGVVAVK